jgi:hypothetical protein
MKLYILIFIFVLSFHISEGQNQSNIWYFGDHAGIDFNISPQVALSDGQTYLRLPQYGWNEGSSVISDNNGSLLFYTDGEKIWNRNHAIMTNGSGLMGHWSSTQSSLIIPQPGSDQFYYVFTTDAAEHNYLNGLRYSIVDICLSNGLGSVLSNAKNIFLADSLTEKLACTPHANGIDYWIMVHRNNSNRFQAYLLTATGITDSLFSNCGNADLNPYPSQAVGQMVFSNDGAKIGYAKPGAVAGLSMLLNFNNASGVVSNAIVLSTYQREYAVAFSPDNSKLYFSEIGYGSIFQYDLNAGNAAAIIASKTYMIQNGPDGWRGMQLAPDGKIYISRTGQNYLSAINNPNNLGPSCNYVSNAISLSPNAASFGLPNFISGFSYSNILPPCVTGVYEFENNIYDINIFPGPSHDYLNISFNSDFHGLFKMFSSDGKLILTDNLNVRKGESIKVDLAGISAGIYLIDVINKSYTMHKKIIVF